MGDIIILKKKRSLGRSLKSKLKGVLILIISKDEMIRQILEGVSGCHKTKMRQSLNDAFPGHNDKLFKIWSRCFSFNHPDELEGRLLDAGVVIHYRDGRTRSRRSARDVGSARKSTGSGPGTFITMSLPNGDKQI